MFNFPYDQQKFACSEFFFDGAIAQLARASRWQREGLGFESP
jgi:hypothetical protein